MGLVVRYMGNGKKTKIENEIWNLKWELKLKIEIEIQEWKLKMGIENEIQNWKWKLKSCNSEWEMR